MSETHSCDAPDCEEQIPRGQLMCRTHWYMLPVPLEKIDMSNTIAANAAAAPAFPGLKADVEFSDGSLRLTLWLSTDPGPVRQFRPFLTVPLDEIGATELLGTAAIALREARQAVS